MNLAVSSPSGRHFGAFSVAVADTPAQRLQTSEWLEAEHFLGSFVPIGHSLVQIIEEEGRPVAILQWAACAYHLKDREAFIGWDKVLCAQRRNLIVNNVRFLVREAARRPNLASKALAEGLKALPGQWHERFGYEPLLAETFTDPESHAGTCYKAAGWTPLGFTGGHRRQRAEFYVPNERPKKLWVKPLRADACEALRARPLAPEHAAGQTSGKGAPLPLTLKQLRPLAEALRGVPDPREPNRFHPLPALLFCVCLGLLCGADNLSAILRTARKLSQSQRLLLGLRRRRGSTRCEIPVYETFRLVLKDIDVKALARILTGWLGEHRAALPANLAMDGKIIRKHLGLIVTLCDIDEKVPVALIASPNMSAQGQPKSQSTDLHKSQKPQSAKEKSAQQMECEQSIARELLRSEEVCLLHSTVSADALYTNDQNARIIVQEKGGEYLFSLKGNQPTVLAYAQSQLEGAPLLSSAKRAPAAL